MLAYYANIQEAFVNLQYNLMIVFEDPIASFSKEFLIFYVKHHCNVGLIHAGS